MKNLRVTVLLLVILLTQVFSVSAAAPVADEPKYGDTFAVGVPSDPQTLNGAISNSYWDKIIASNVLSMLVRLDYNMNPVPDLAKSWTISDDGLTYTFNLRSGVKWHDGKTFSAADVKYSMEEIILKYHPRSNTFDEAIASIETPDDDTVIFHLEKPYGPFMNLLGYDFFVLPMHLYNGTDIMNNPYNSKPVGTGPFIFEEWSRGSHVALVKNSGYFQEGLPYLDRLVFRVIPDATSRVLALETGEIHYIANQALPSSAVPEFSGKPDFTIIDNTGFESLGSIIMLTLNLESPQLKNVLVRKALYSAIDRNYIFEQANYGLGRVADSTFTSDSWAYEPNVTKYPYDPEAAKTLLDEAGFPAGEDGTRMTLRLTCDANVELIRKSCEIVKYYLEEIGVKVNFEPVERGVMLDRVYTNRDFDMQIHNFSTGADPAIDVARLYVSSNIRPVSFTNGSAYRNSIVDELCEKGANSSVPAERAGYYREMQRILSDELPVLWLIEVGHFGVYNKRFHNLHSWSSYSYYIFWDVWSENGKPLQIAAESSGQAVDVQQPTDEISTQPVDQGSDSPSTAMLVTIVVLVAVVAVIFIRMWKRKKSQDEGDM